MNRITSSKAFIAAAVAFGSLAAVSAAHARTDVAVSIGVPVGYAQPATVYVQPRPVYVQPQPVYVQPRTGYYGSHRGYRANERARNDRWGDVDRDGIENVFDRDWRYYEPRAAHLAAMEKNRGDADGDGVQNRFDRAPHNRYVR
ncbi:MAG TPA: PXPV repeat protein [Ramlibacter sp.]|uniref:PXPV repeat protein n=1 Tax=Ramlibacter sp. TaxID=1917967 RepID=UPI002D7EE478|nr:PXPV repeat protein [Ramlibacter sp.]HET8746717.1 PXPV repeat protein [Ramlibacter sp.]